MESSKIILQKLWMDTKRKETQEERALMTQEISATIKNFRPDLIMLGDDNAVKYIGNQFFDSEIPIVFWGVNNTPVKYGLVDSKEQPGHNVTGVYQSGYYSESIELVKTLVPKVKTFAVLSDDTSSGRSHAKKINYLARNGLLPLELTDIVMTSDYPVWQAKALALQDKVDVIFLAQYSGLKDSAGKSVPTEAVSGWYLHNIKIPEAAVQGQFVKQGMLCSADDSGYNQGYEAVFIAHDILANGADPSTYPPRAPKRGPLMVNKQRAKQLGIELTEAMGIEEYIEESSIQEKEQTQ
ncbi:MAG: ABC transporter substrate binding protein [Desulfuromonadaceae bacterium]